MRKNLLFYRIVIFNVLALVGVAVAYQYDLLTAVLETDISHVTEVILGLVAFGIIASLKRGWNISQDINTWENKTMLEFPVYRSTHPANNKFLLNLAEAMVILGVIGNCIGFRVALSSQDALISGASTGFGASIFGLAAALWMLINYWTLETATENYITVRGGK